MRFNITYMFQFNSINALSGWMADINGDVGGF